MEIKAIPPKSTVMSVKQNGHVQMWLDGNIENEAMTIEPEAMDVFYTHFNRGQDGEQILSEIRECLQRWIEMRGHEFKRDGTINLTEERAEAVLKEMNKV